MSHEQKPPLGLKPRFILDLERQTEILDACRRYIFGAMPIPVDWLDELREIAERERVRHERRDAQKRERDPQFQRTSDEAETRRMADRDAKMPPSGNPRRAKVCEAAITYPHDYNERIAALAKSEHYHRFDSGSGHCEGCGMHKSEYDPSARDACMAFPSDGRSVSARQQLLLWAQHHLHVFGESKCVNCGLSIDEYENVEWTTLVPCPASLPEGTTEV